MFSSFIKEPVTTDISEVPDFLAGPATGFALSSRPINRRVVGEASRRVGAFDLAIFDEAHKTAGREGANFGFALENRNLQIGKRVFLTATPRHYDVRKKYKEGDKALVYSMDQPAIYGPRPHALFRSSGGTRHHLQLQNYHLHRDHDDQCRSVEPRRGDRRRQCNSCCTVANQIAIQKACEEHDLSHRSVASAKDFTGDTASSIQTHLPDYEASTSMARCAPPAAKRGWDENPQLGSWVTIRRTQQKRGALSADRKKRLEELGFV
jgi:hypothetical protein